MNLMGHVNNFDFILTTKKNCQRVLRRKVTRSDLHFNSISVASRCVYVRWCGGLGGRGRRGEGVWQEWKLGDHLGGSCYIQMKDCSGLKSLSKSLYFLLPAETFFFKGNLMSIPHL